MGLKALFTLVNAPYPDALFNKPFHNKRRFVRFSAESVKHKYQQDIKFTFFRMERIVKTAETFRTKTAVCVNKADVNPAKTGEIRAFCRERNLPFAGTIPFDAEAIKAINRGKNIAELDIPSGRAVRSVYEKVMELLWKEAKQHGKPVHPEKQRRMNNGW